MKLDTLTKHAIHHTLHCLLGCSIGEILGMVIASSWSNMIQTILSIVLAFFFGYLLTSRSLIRSGANKKAAIRGALATDTVSITSMEIVDNSFIWFIPGAIHATLSSALFWWSLALSLVIAFVITVPVNRYVMSRKSDTHHL
jgi:ABC-type lipoprotein release transport system permease subunit